jgi:hypothetical protein
MPFQLSPGVNVTEIDLTTIVPAVSSSTGAIAGVFNWGPINQRILIDSETALVNMFGKPSSNNYQTWFTAANFLSYTNSLYVVRAQVSACTHNAVGSVGMYSGHVTILNASDFVYKKEANFDPDAIYAARYPGAIGNSIKVSVCDSVNAYSSMIDLTDVTISLNTGSNTATLTGAGVEDAVNSIVAGDYLVVGNSSIGTQNLKISEINAVVDHYTKTVYHITTYRLTAAPHTIITAAAYAELTTQDKALYASNIITISSTAYDQLPPFEQTDYTSEVINKTVSEYNMLSVSDKAAYSVVLSTDGLVHFTGTFAKGHNWSQTGGTVERLWEYHNLVNGPPATSDYVANFGNTAAVDTLHIVVTDEGGKFTGTAGAVLEAFTDVSRAKDSKTVGGQKNYYMDIINDMSKYIWVLNELGTDEYSNTAMNISSTTNYIPTVLNFDDGADGYNETDIPLSGLIDGYDLFVSSEDVDISLILQGAPNGSSAAVGNITAEKFGLANWIIDNICEVRKDCVAFISPDDFIVYDNYGNESTALVAWRSVVRDSSYAVLDSGFKYMYDRYNDMYRWVPLNGDVAGLCARTDNQRDPWWSPAGFNRGQIKNLVKLRYNPRKSERDNLYKNGINPVVSFPGQGTILYGDKTLQSKPSAFDRINVRRLFIVLEKAIATASKYSLFEFNDDFTRTQFKNLITPYLREIQGRRGITDFLVVCDGTNNTPERIDRNEFWGDIYIKPARSINFIQLNFVAVATGVQFSEVVGQF